MAGDDDDVSGRGFCDDEPIAGRGDRRRFVDAGCFVPGALVLVVMALGFWRYFGPSPSPSGWEGKAPPELASGGTWLNANGPLTLASLRGKVVWLEFSFLG
jgi:hypothetical protein